MKVVPKSRWYYHPPSKLWEGNVFSHVCPWGWGESHVMHWCIGIGPHCTASPAQSWSCSPGYWDFTVQWPPWLQPPSTWDLTVRAPAGDIWWPRLKTCSNLFTWGPPHPPLLAPGTENAHTVSASGWYVSYWNAFLVYIFSMAHPRFRGRKRPTQEEVQTYFKPVFSKKLARKWNQI